MKSRTLRIISELHDCYHIIKSGEQKISKCFFGKRIILFWPLDQKLYQSETLSTIHMPDYIYELAEYLRESYSIRENIGFSLQIENIELDHASAITLGLILNEAITNAINMHLQR